LHVAITCTPGRSGIGATKLSAEPQTESDNTPPTTFVPVRMAVEPDAAVIEIVLSGGERLHVRPGASADLVRAVVTALRSSC
jgi:hypothetical protein